MIHAMALWITRTTREIAGFVVSSRHA